MPRTENSNPAHAGPSTRAMVVAERVVLAGNAYHRLERKQLKGKLFPASLGQWFGQSPGMEWLQEISLQIAPGQPLNIILFSAGIIFFCFWYTSIMFNPKEVADNLKKSGAFVPGYRPGDQTARYIDSIITRLTLFGSLYMTLVCLLPQFLVIQFNITFQLGGTALLIVVVVVMDFMAQVQTHLMSHQYESLMKKSNLQNFGRR